MADLTFHTSYLAKDLSVSRGQRRLLQGVNFEIDAGSVLWLRGPNGSGKTSLLRVLAGLAEADEGIFTEQASAKPDPATIHYVGHQTGLSANLTVVENLQFYGQLFADADVKHAVEALGLSQFLDLEVRYLSEGQRRRVALARLIMCPRPLWLLDEPMANLDDATRGLIQQAIADHTAAGGCVILTGHQKINSVSAELDTEDFVPALEQAS